MVFLFIYLFKENSKLKQMDRSSVTNNIINFFFGTATEITVCRWVDSELGNGKGVLIPPPEGLEPSLVWSETSTLSWIELGLPARETAPQYLRNCSVNTFSLRSRTVARIRTAYWYYLGSEWPVLQNKQRGPGERRLDYYSHSPSAVMGSESTPGIMGCGARRSFLRTLHQIKDTGQWHWRWWGV